MKKLLLIAGLIFIARTSFAQDAQIDAAVGYVTKGDFAFGLDFKNLTSKKIGFYFNLYGFGATYPTGMDGVDYSSIADDINVKENVSQVDPDFGGVAGGLILNTGALLNKEALKKLHLLVGGGIHTDTYYQVDEWEFVFDFSSEEYAWNTFVKEKVQKPTFDIGLHYNVSKPDAIMLWGVGAHYNTGIGAAGLIYMGFPL